MYAEEYVSGVNTEKMAVVIEHTKGQYRTVTTSSKNLGTAYITKGLAATVLKHIPIEGGDELDEMFDIFCGNCKLRNVASDYVTVSNDPKKHDDQPYSTTILVGKRAAETIADSDALSMSVFAFQQSTRKYDAILHLASRKKDRAAQYALTADMHAEMYGRGPVERLAEILQEWPSAGDTLEVGGLVRYTVTRVVTSKNRVHFTFEHDHESRPSAPPLIVNR